MKNINYFTTIREAEFLAKKKIRKGSFNWLNSGAEDNYTTDLNISFLNSIKFYPRVLNKNSNLSLNTNFFKKKINSPIILSPMGHQAQFHKFGEIETAKGVQESSSIGFFSTQSRYSFKEIRKNNKNANLVWQIFLFGSKKWIEKEIKEAEKNKSLAISLCLDAPVRSHRYLDRESRYDARKFGRMRVLSENPNFALSYDWEIIKWLKKKTKLPLILKGIITSEDAKLAYKFGADYIWVSNHGGRMLNSGISSGEALLKIKKELKNKIPLIVDGGVRKGSDIAKYLSLGASFVGIGRPAIYGLILDGKKGVKKTFSILNEELRTFMLNSGCKNIKDLNLNRIFIPKI